MGVEDGASEVKELVAEAGCRCCTVVAVGEAVEVGVGTGAESERETFPEDAEPEAEVEYPLDILETRFLQYADNTQRQSSRVIRERRARGE